MWIIKYHEIYFRWCDWRFWCPLSLKTINPIKNKNPALLQFMKNLMLECKEVLFHGRLLYRNMICPRLRSINRFFLYLNNYAGEIFHPRIEEIIISNIHWYITINNYLPKPWLETSSLRTGNLLTKLFLSTSWNYYLILK